MSERADPGMAPTTAVAGAPELRFPRYRLTVVEGPDRDLGIDGGAAELAIGTAPANTMILTDPAVSRHHIAITPTARGHLVRDLGSTNGTAINGVAVERAYLAPGAVIAIGRSRLRFDVVEGETGTGKGLLAEAIHDASPRAGAPFIVLDCGAIPPTLIESELFGHEKGAFTGAAAARTGGFEAARGGTVFLDEIGELPLDMQPKLLRALEDRVVKRVGGNEPVRLDIRIIAATNRDLRAEINQGRFRSDLYYRLNTFRLRIPPLRERREDIALLVAHFHRQLSQGGEAPPAELIAELTRHDWPGNVRELRAAVERAVLLGDPAVWRALCDDAPPPAEDERFAEGTSFRASKERAVAAWEREYTRALITRYGGNLSRAARAVRMDRNHLRELLRRHKITADDS